MPMLVITCKEGGFTHPLKENTPVFIGRAKGCDIHLSSPAVSRRHAVIIYKNGLCGVKDLDSFNGTLLNGVPITRPSHLTESDILTISSYCIRFHSQATVESLPQAPRPPVPADENGTDVTVSGIPGVGASPRADRDDRKSTMRADKKESAPAAPAAPPPERALGKAPEIPPPHAGGPELAAPGVKAAHTGDAADSTIELSRPAAYAAELAATVQADLEAMLPDSPPSRGVPDPDGGSAPKEAGHSRPAPAPSAPDSPELPARPDAETVPLPDNIPESGPPPTPVGNAEAANQRPEAHPPLDDGPPKDAAGQEPGQTPNQSPGEAPAHPGQADDPDETTFWTKGHPGPDTAGFGSASGLASPSPRDAVDDSVRTNLSTRLSLKAKDGTTPPGVEAPPVSPGLMEAMDARLALYAQLTDLSEQRRLYRMANPDMSPEAAAELSRQDGELGNLPSAEEADKRLQGMRDAAPEAEAEGAAEQPDRPSSSLPPDIEELAHSQWRLIRDSNRDALPRVFKEAYRLAADEDLVRELSSAGIRHDDLVGGAVYLMALSAMAEAVRADRNAISARLESLSGDGPAEKPNGLLAKLNRAVSRLMSGESTRDEARKLKEREQDSRRRAELVLREFNFIERFLFNEFQAVYGQTAAHFAPLRQRMPLAVRAFLRYGAVGLKPWWMPGNVREFIVRDCSENVVPSFEVGPKSANIVYADEYLTAVARLECPPFPDENLRGVERNAVEWRTERAYRRIVGSRAYAILLEDLLQDLDERARALGDEAKSLERRLAEAGVEPSTPRKQVRAELEMRHEMTVIRKTNLERQIRRVEREVVASILESVKEAEERFREGELRMPDAEALVLREARAMADIARRMGGPGPRFMPLMLRAHFPVDPDAGIVNDRNAVEARVRHIEHLDPGLFMSSVLPAKKKEYRVELRLSPVIVILPAVGIKGVCATGREGMDGGHLALPICLGREHIRNRQLSNLMADFRWKTSLNLAGRDVMHSDTLAGAFTKIRWEWRNAPKEKREEGLIFNDVPDAKNWRRIYELYLSDAMTGARQLFHRNPECYSAIINKYITLPEGVKMLKK